MESGSTNPNLPDAEQSERLLPFIQRNSHQFYTWIARFVFGLVITNLAVIAGAYYYIFALLPYQAANLALQSSQDLTISIHKVYREMGAAESTLKRIDEFLKEKALIERLESLENQTIEKEKNLEKRLSIINAKITSNEKLIDEKYTIGKASAFLQTIKDNPSAASLIDQYIQLYERINKTTEELSAKLEKEYYSIARYPVLQRFRTHPVNKDLVELQGGGLGGVNK